MYLRVYKSTRKHRYDSRELKKKEVGKDRRRRDLGVLSGVGRQTRSYRTSVRVL